MKTPFLPTYPASSILEDDCKRPIFVRSGSSKAALLVFTDRDLLERYRRDKGCAGPAIVFDVPQQLVLYLDSLSDDISHVVFDPNTQGGEVTLVPFKSLYADVLRQASSGK